ncbi:putative ABC transporter permease subunit [Acetobacterium woodii]|uniref:ABC transport system permease protein n=1 Tax=Acetobacterium woodii (strain ATCC 29683 / DSM 1030 / JCM 2381 / KCTC 1655 / WB1) TaxID=931626 RepID=H6LCM3_ACEWD|nr:ABC transporter permease [Acetobacterium woodii]AFA47805.1 ABC transport system permease protein [Acetobacterium woodii DSM 1030]
MKDIINLTKLFINESVGFSQFFYNRKYNKKEFYKQLFTMIIVPVALIPAFFMYISLMVATYIGLGMVNQTSVFLSIGYIMATVLIIIFGIMYIFSEFYFSNNIEELIPLPISPRKLIISKFFSIMVFEYIFTAFIFVPVLIIYGVGEGMGFVYVILSLLVFLTIPVIPLALLTALIMLIMQSASVKGRQDVLRIIFAFLGIGLIFGVQIWFSTQIGSGDADFQQALNVMLSNNEGFLSTIGYFVPTSFIVAWALNRITLMSVVWVFALWGVAVLACTIMVLIGERVYLKSIVSGKVMKRGKQLNGVERNKALGKKSHGAMAVFMMDLRILLRTPVYFFNNFSVVFIAPICIIITFSFIEMTPEDLQGIQVFFNEMPVVINFLLISFFIFFGGTSATTATTFSREGKASWMTRIIPVTAKDQIIGRTGVALLTQSLGIIFTIMAVKFVFPLSLSSLVLSGVLGIIGSVPILLFGLFIDMNRPKLNWDNPQKAIKNNMNVIITLFVGMIYAGLLIAISGLVGYFVNQLLGYCLFVLISLALSFAFYKLIDNRLVRELLNFE